MTARESNPRPSAQIALRLTTKLTGRFSGSYRCKKLINSVVNHTLPALGVLVKSVHLIACRLGFYSQSGHTKDLKNSIRSFSARRSAQAEVRRVLCMCCSSCMSLNSVQSFVIENCNGPTIENGLNDVCLHPLSRTFTFYRCGRSGVRFPGGHMGTVLPAARHR